MATSVLETTVIIYIDTVYISTNCSKMEYSPNSGYLSANPYKLILTQPIN